MKTRITTLDVKDLQKVDELGRPFKKTIGFLTEEALGDYLRKSRILGAWTTESELAGYLLFADYSHKFRIGQLCVDSRFQGKGIARQLIEALKATATSQTAIKLRCRRDFPAHHIWPRFGFVPLEEKIGRSSEGHPLVLWCHTLKSDDELGLWRAQETEETLDVVIDAQIFFDFDEQDTPKTLISKSLRNDFLLDSLALWVTDEIFQEINRHNCPKQRMASLKRAHGFARVKHDLKRAEAYIKKLKSILPFEKPNEISDIYHIAKTAASDIQIFTTRDNLLLKFAEPIKRITGVEIIHPANLISSIHEEIEKRSYAPARITGLGLMWHRFRKGDLDDIQDTTLLADGETKGKLLEVLRYYFSQPLKFRCQALKAHGKTLAIRIIDTSSDLYLRVPLVRFSNSARDNLHAEFVAADAIAFALSEGFSAVIFEKNSSSDHIGPILLKMGFFEENNSFTRATIAKFLDRPSTLALMDQISPNLSFHHQASSDLELEQSCAPLLSQSGIPCFLVPIKPGFAMGLIDQGQAAEDLFGGDPSVLLRWENVYYRKCSRHKMLRGPARIFWYVSDSIGAIVAISHLDKVEIATPKDLFKKYQKFGVLEWPDIYNICEKNIETPIMALKFSRTFLFRQKIPLSQMRSIFSEENHPESLQSPSQLPAGVAKKLFNFGYPGNQ